MGMFDVEGRHPSVRDVARTLEPNPNLSGEPAAIASGAAVLAADWLGRIPDGPELVIALRLLRQTKDAAIVAYLFPPQPAPERPTGPERPQ